MTHSMELAEERLIARYFRPLAIRAPSGSAMTRPNHAAAWLRSGLTAIVVCLIRAEKVLLQGVADELSDSAGKRAKPLSVALPAAIDEAWIAAFAAGSATTRRSTLPAAGRPRRAVVDFDRLPSARCRTAPRRCGARRQAGEAICHWHHRRRCARRLVAARREFSPTLAPGGRDERASAGALSPAQPRNALTAVREQASAAMDVSDGLAGRPPPKSCRASGSAARDARSVIPTPRARSSALHRDGTDGRRRL